MMVGKRTRVVGGRGEGWRSGGVELGRGKERPRRERWRGRRRGHVEEIT